LERTARIQSVDVGLSSWAEPAWERDRHPSAPTPATDQKAVHI
jgi:hypothetical protein